MVYYITHPKVASKIGSIPRKLLPEDLQLLFPGRLNVGNGIKTVFFSPDLFLGGVRSRMVLNLKRKEDVDRQKSFSSQKLSDHNGGLARGLVVMKDKAFDPFFWPTSTYIVS